MAKLYFRYGTMNSGKTLNLLAVAHNYENRQTELPIKKKVVIAKPAVDTRFGRELVHSRAGIDRDADILLRDETSIYTMVNEPQQYACILVDEAQFLTAAMVDSLRKISINFDIPVICYGLRADFKSQLFEGSKRLLEVADTIEEIKTVCTFCDQKATMNMKYQDGRAVDTGPSVELGAEEKYMPACWNCYSTAISSRGMPWQP
jgi:thymidine kinase